MEKTIETKTMRFNLEQETRHWQGCLEKTERGAMIILDGNVSLEGGVVLKQNKVSDQNPNGNETVK